MAKEVSKKKFECDDCGHVENYNFEVCPECGYNTMTMQEYDELYDDKGIVEEQNDRY
jgi:predicted ATP-dependent serine protease